MMPAAMSRTVALRHDQFAPAARTRGAGLEWLLVLVGFALSGSLVGFGVTLEAPVPLLLSFGPLLWRIDRETLPGFLVGPSALMYLFHVLGYAVGPLGYRYILQYVPFMAEGFIPAQWGAALGLLAFALSYPPLFRLACRRFERRSPVRFSDKGWYSFGLLMIVPSFVFLAYGFLSGAQSRLARVVDVDIAKGTFTTAFQYVQLVMFFFLAYSARKRGGMAIVVWLTSLVAYGGSFLLDGSRGPMVHAIIFSAVGLHLAGMSLRKLATFGLITAVAFIPISSIALYYRLYTDRPTNMAERVQSFVDAGFAYKFLVERVDNRGVEAFLFAVTAQAVDRVFWLTPSSIPFAYGDGLWKVPYAFVPRVFYRDRPELYDANDVAAEYGSVRVGQSGAYMPTVGDGYRRLGWPGIPLLYLLASASFAIPIAFCWMRRDRLECVAMLIFLITQAPGIWSSTLLVSIYRVVWIFPKYFVLFLLLAWIHSALLERSRSVARLGPAAHCHPVTIGPGL